jgi:hypothetical protein
MRRWSAEATGKRSSSAKIILSAVAAVFLWVVHAAPSPSWGQAGAREGPGGLAWEMPGRLSIHDIQFGPVSWKDKKWEFLGNIRTINASRHPERLTLMVKFSYTGSRPPIPVKLVIRLPQCRQFEETVNLREADGVYSYMFTMHRPEEFVGAGSVYLYYGFSIIDVLDFTIRHGS